MTSFRTLRPGVIPYAGALELQEELVERRRHGGENVLVLLQHTPVVTLGRGAKDTSLLCPPETLAKQGVDCVRVSRGGDVTFHGPGQAVGYPIVHLDHVEGDVHRFLRLLEATLILALGRMGIDGERVEGKTGVWVGGKKIASLGIGVRHWISWHGWALNVSNDLSGFETINPCGMPGVQMTSISRLLGQPISVNAVEDILIEAFAETLTLTCAGYYEFESATQTGLA
ncbi:MAG TPA: lipoyl(octanoyl) transferase LipB [Desulfuromonadales bacterium]|nr:lipoyl(octanoyl) transferase LipB [Desulfuromonadales bacterium]